MGSLTLKEQAELRKIDRLALMKKATRAQISRGMALRRKRDRKD